MRRATFYPRTKMPWWFLAVFVATLLLVVNTLYAQEDPTIPELAEAYQKMERAHSAMKSAESRGDKQAMEQAQERYRHEERQMHQHLAHVAGVKPEDIGAMRRAGMGWSQVCEELGLNPGIMGRHHQETPDQTRLRQHQLDQHRTREHMEATSRHTNEAHAPKHGMASMGYGSHGMGMGMVTGAHSEQSARGFAGMSHGSHGHGGMGGAAGSGSGGPGGGGPGGGGPGGGGHGGGGGSGGGGHGGGGHM
jgi:hypothetical protein